MAGRGLTWLLALVAVLALAPSAAAQSPAGFASDNVEHLRNIPDHFDSSGARLLDGHFYITTSRDLAIYDVSQPESPKKVGGLQLPLPGEPTLPEEDVDTNGRILLAENQGTLFVVDVSDKADPKILS